MGNQQFSDNVATTQVIPATGANTTPVNSSWVRVNGSGVRFIGSLGTANAGNNVKLQYSSDGTNSLGDVAGSATPSPGNGKSFQIELTNPQYPFVRAVVTRGASTTVDPWIADVFEKNDRPGTNTVANEFTTKSLTNAILGTA